MATAYQATAAKNRYYASRARDTASFEIGQSRARADQRIARVGAQYSLMADTVASIGSVLTQTVGNYYQFRAKQDGMALELAQEGRQYQLQMREQQRLDEMQNLNLQIKTRELLDLKRRSAMEENTAFLQPQLAGIAEGINNQEPFDVLQARFNDLSQKVKGAAPGTLDPSFLSQLNATRTTLNQAYAVSWNGKAVPMDQAARYLEDTGIDPNQRVELFNTMKNDHRLGEVLGAKVKAFETSADADFLTALKKDKERTTAASLAGLPKADYIQLEQSSFRTKIANGMSVPDALQAVELERSQILAPAKVGTEKENSGDAFTLPMERGWERLTIDPAEYGTFAAESIDNGQAGTRGLKDSAGNVVLTVPKFYGGQSAAPGTSVRIGRFGLDYGRGGSNGGASSTLVSEITPASAAENYAPVVLDIAKRDPNINLQQAALITTVDDAYKVLSTTPSPKEFKKALDLLGGAAEQGAKIDSRSRGLTPGIATDVLTDDQVKVIKNRATRMGVSESPAIVQLDGWLKEYREVKPEVTGGNAILQQMAAPGASGPAQTIVVPFKGKKRTLELPQGAVVDSANKTVRLGDRIMTFDEMADMKFAGEAP